METRDDSRGGEVKKKLKRKNLWEKEIEKKISFCRKRFYESFRKSYRT